ncbi:MAG: hypothetical protein IH986_16160 [Planctomycetes bacterium]|nr:hypothetical protein [Planctomycetota bacterium]
MPFDWSKGFDELSMWALTVGTEENPESNRSRTGFGPMGPWQMFLEGSMGHAGALGRQVTLNTDSADREVTETLLAAIERAALDRTIVLQGEGVRLADAEPVPVTFTFKTGGKNKGLYRASDGSGLWSRDRLLEGAVAGELIVTLTGYLGRSVDPSHPQPAIWAARDPIVNSGIQTFPRLPEDNPMRIFGRHLEKGAKLFVDGRRVRGSVTCARGGKLPNCTDEALEVHLVEPPPQAGMYLVQLQTRHGLLSNEFLFYVD